MPFVVSGAHALDRNHNRKEISTMTDLTIITGNVSRWTGLGIKLPKELAKAIEVFEALALHRGGPLAGLRPRRRDAGQR